MKTDTTHHLKGNEPALRVVQQQLREHDLERQQKEQQQPWAPQEGIAQLVRVQEGRAGAA